MIPITFRHLWVTLYVILIFSHVLFFLTGWSHWSRRLFDCSPPRCARPACGCRRPRPRFVGMVIQWDERMERTAVSWEYHGNIMGMAMQWKIYCTGIKSLLGGMWPLVVKSRESRTMEGASLETRLVRPPWKAEGETWITHTNFTGPFVGGFYDC